MTNSPHWLNNFFTAATAMPTENLAVVAITMVALAVIRRQN